MGVFNKMIKISLVVNLLKDEDSHMLLNTELLICEHSALPFHFDNQPQAPSLGRKQTKRNCCIYPTSFILSLHFLKLFAPMVTNMKQ